MSKMKVWLMTLVLMFASLGSLIELIKEIKEIKKLKVKSNDRDIKAIVVDSLPYRAGDIQPIVQYDVRGTNKKYIYHFYYNQKKYPIGKEVTLKLSEDSGLAYDRTDLVKALVYDLLAIMIGVFCVSVCIIYYNIFFKR